jgi:tellurite resistance protein TerC
MNWSGIIYWRRSRPEGTVFGMAPALGLWVVFSLTVASMLAVDLGLFQRTPRAPTAREAAAWTAAWVALATLFGLGVFGLLGATRATEFFTAYLVEKALSVDNLLVVMILFERLRVPAAAQRKVLVAGVGGAVVLRTLLIVVGTSLVARFHTLTYVLGALLVYAAIKLLGAKTETEPGHGGIAERISKLLPVATAYDGTRFFTRRGGALLVTPLLVAVLAVEAADFTFALDSIPAVFGVTSDRMVALTSNVFAVMGLRSLYFLLADLLGRLRHLQTGLAIVLAFVGGKMLLSFAYEVPTLVSLFVIVAVLGGASVLSLRSSRHSSVLPGGSK